MPVNLWLAPVELRLTPAESRLAPAELWFALISADIQSGGYLTEITNLGWGILWGEKISEIPSPDPFWVIECC